MSLTDHRLPLSETVAPADEAAVAAVLRKAGRAKTAVYPLGGGTNLAYGLRASRQGIGLSTASLDDVLDYSAADLTITVGAGLTIGDLGRRLASQKQWLPIDVPQPERATIGGVVAANTLGPRRYAYGTIRDYLLGVRAVDGRGAVFAGGGRVVKNAAGYNIPRLLAGSLGTLGVITEVTLMVRPLPQCSALVLCDAADFETAECLLVALNRSRTFPVAVELLAGRCRPGCPWGDMPGDAVARLIVGFDGSEPEVEWMLHRLCDEWRAAGARCLAGLRGDHAVTAWNWLAEAFGQVQINVLPSALVGVTEELIGGLPGISLQAHAGNGAIRVELPSAASRAGRLAADPFATLVRHRLRPVAADAGGHLLVLAYPDDAELTAADIWGPLCDGEAVMRRIRERFDPAGILNPGRFVFGT